MEELKEKISTGKKILLPFNVFVSEDNNLPSHWVLYVISRSSNNSINIVRLDSNSISTSYDKHKDQVHTFVKNLFPTDDIQSVQEDVPQQSGNECGLYVIFEIFQILIGKKSKEFTTLWPNFKFDTKQYVQKKYLEFLKTNEEHTDDKARKLWGLFAKMQSSNDNQSDPASNRRHQSNIRQAIASDNGWT